LLPLLRDALALFSCELLRCGDAGQLLRGDLELDVMGLAQSLGKRVEVIGVCLGLCEVPIALGAGCAGLPQQAFRSRISIWASEMRLAPRTSYGLGTRITVRCRQAWRASLSWLFVVEL
jgi:hypothetical protein